MSALVGTRVEGVSFSSLRGVFLDHCLGRHTPLVMFLGTTDHQKLRRLLLEHAEKYPLTNVAVSLFEWGVLLFQGCPVVMDEDLKDNEVFLVVPDEVALEHLKKEKP